jgi:hypothetical protein
MPDLFGRLTALEAAAEALQDSANAHGTSNAPVARFALLAVERIEHQERRISDLALRVRELEGGPA